VRSLRGGSLAWSVGLLWDLDIWGKKKERFGAPHGVCCAAQREVCLVQGGGLACLTGAFAGGLRRGCEWL